MWTRAASRTAGAAAAAAVTVAILAGCSSPEATFESAVGQGIAAVETAVVAVDQQLADRTFTTTALATLGDARRELVDASTSVAETDAADPSEAALRAEVLGALDAGLDAVNEARDAMAAGVGSLGATVPQLEDAADELEALEPRIAAGGAR